MKPYYDHKGITIYHGDCREILPTLPKVDLVLTDPPYSSGGFQASGGVNGSIGNKTGATIVGDNLSTRGYTRLIKGIASGTKACEIYVFCDWKMWTPTCDALEDGFYRIRNMIVWNKKTPGMGVGWRCQHELICYGRRGPAIPGPGHGNVLTFPRSGNKSGHPTEKPINLLIELLNGSDGGTVLDPFMGSGTTLRAAKDLGRKAIGIEIEEKYCEIVAKRLSQEVLPLTV